MHETNPDLVGIKTAVRQLAVRLENEAKASSQWASLAKNRGVPEVAVRLENVVVAYEPIWAIGTGMAATAADADEVCGIIRDVLAKDFGKETAEAVRIQYGGSVTPDNVSEIMGMANVDGALVGGASLKSDVFSKIVRFS